MIAWVPEDSPRGRHFFDKIGWKPTGDIDVLTVYPQDRNRVIEYSRQPKTIDYTRGLPRPATPAITAPPSGPPLMAPPPLGPDDATRHLPRPTLPAPIG